MNRKSDASHPIASRPNEIHQSNTPHSTQKNSRTGPLFSVVKIDRLSPFIRVTIGKIMLPKIASGNFHRGRYDCKRHPGLLPSRDACARSINKRNSSGVPYKRVGANRFHSVITPTETPRKFRHRHHLDRGDSQPCQFWQLFDCRGPRAFSRERSKMHFVKHLSIARNSRPFFIRPFELSTIHNLRWTMRPFWLKSRSGIRKCALLQFELIQHPGQRIGDVCGKITLLSCFHFNQLARRRRKFSVFAQLHVHSSCTLAPTLENARRRLAITSAPTGYRLAYSEETGLRSESLFLASANGRGARVDVFISVEFAIQLVWKCSLRKWVNCQSSGLNP